MNNHSEAFVAFDSSKLRNAVAIAECGRTGEIRFLGEIENTGTATAKLVRKLADRAPGGLRRYHRRTATRTAIPRHITRSAIAVCI